ncbi:ATP-binding protein [Candidatus Venteria ishoeyi]|nr:ATP-binding protein [Candidatus Venteria ishoeyi]
MNFFLPSIFMKVSQYIPFNKRLSTHLAAWVLVITISLGLVFSALQVYLDYFNVRAEFDNTINQVLKTMEKPAAQAAYTMDAVLAYDVVMGLFKYEAIRKVALLDEIDNALAEEEKEALTSKINWFSSLFFERQRIYTVQLYANTYTENEEVFGSLKVTVDLHLLASGFLDRAMIVLLSTMAWNLILGALIFLLFQYLVNRPLNKVTSTLATIDPAHPHLTLNCPEHHQEDELGQLINTTNTLLNAIDTRVNEREVLLQRMEMARQAAEVANIAKSQFIAKMSHELRTPLNAIIGYSEMLQDEIDEMTEQEMIEDLTRIHGAGTHLLNMVNDILDISKIESGRMELNIEKVPVCDLIEEIFTIVEPRAEKNKNTLQFECPKTLDDFYTDATKLQQSLLNLLDNACKYTEAGNISFLTKKIIRDDRTWLIFQITDTGVGMSREQRDQVFVAFSQADDSSTRAYDGIGLGLSITKNLLDMLGGDISLETESGKGSTFIVHIPSLEPTE